MGIAEKMKCQHNNNSINLASTKMEPFYSLVLTLVLEDFPFPLQQVQFSLSRMPQSWENQRSGYQNHHQQWHLPASNAYSGFPMPERGKKKEVGQINNYP